MAGDKVMQHMGGAKSGHGWQPMGGSGPVVACLGGTVSFAPGAARLHEGNLAGESGRFRTAVGPYGWLASGPIMLRARLCSGLGPVNLFQYSMYFPIAFK
jgi:hypothetical protein